MTKNLLLRFGVAALACLLLVACAQSELEVSPAPSATPQPAPTATATLTLVPTATPTRSLSAPRIPTTGEFPLGEDFLFEDQTPTCQLPCWQGLVVGKSGQEDVQSVFDFNYGGEDSGIVGMISLFHYWSPATEIGTQFAVEIIMDDDTHTLRSIGFSWLTLPGASPFVDIDPQRVIAELGEPDFAMAAVLRTAMGKMADVHVLMVYRQGTQFEFSYILDVDDRPSGDTVRFCLGQQVGQIEGRVTITEPLTDGLEDLTAVQARFINPDRQYYDLVPLEEIFTVSAKEVTSRIQQGEDVCLTAALD
jgi:hypothetical protein